ncbi:MAG: hypothetical protein ACK5EA_01480 [Planctomycetaceae bacterium]|jgi:hypothetical protein
MGAIMWIVGLDGVGGLARGWYAIPLILAISLVYSASRHENTSLILVRAARLVLTIGGFMLAVLAVLLILSRGG